MKYFTNIRTLSDTEFFQYGTPKIRFLTKKPVLSLIALLVLVFFVVSEAKAFSCHYYATTSQVVTFKKQTEIDSFHNTGCQIIGGDLIIKGGGLISPITNLKGLSNVHSIRGKLWLYKTKKLNDLSGLENLLERAGSSSGLGGSLIITSTHLTSLKGLDNLNSIGLSINISGNPALRNINSLDNVRSVKGSVQIINNGKLENLNGLRNLNSIRGHLTINSNKLLTSLKGIQNIDPNTIRNLTLRYNSKLANCHVASICGVLSKTGSNRISISRNARGKNCESKSKVEQACGIDKPAQLTLTCPPSINITAPFGKNQQRVSWNIRRNTTCSKSSAVTLKQTSGKPSGSLFTIGNHRISYEATDQCSQSKQCSFNVKVQERTSSCPDKLNLYTQQSVDNFATKYPGCTQLKGHVQIGYPMHYYTLRSKITNLHGLSQLTSISGSLSITSVSSLTNLSGLNNLTRIGSLKLWYNPDLNSLTGLGKLKSISSGLSIIDNPSLSRLNGLSQLSSIGGNLNIKGAFSSSTRGGLTHLSGLNRLTKVGGALNIISNHRLTSLSGLNKLSFVGKGVSILSNSRLRNLSGLDSLKRINGSLRIIGNRSLTNLRGVRNINPASIKTPSRYARVGKDLSLRNNRSLSQCSFTSICKFLNLSGKSSEIGSNAASCNSKTEIKSACRTVSLPTTKPAIPCQWRKSRNPCGWNSVPNLSQPGRLPPWMTPDYEK